MQNKENIHFLTEGYLDTLLSKEYLKIPDSQIHQKNGKGKIKQFLAKRNKNANLRGQSIDPLCCRRLGLFLFYTEI